jgi:tetratricopeptide (TPR) repeat protein
MNTDRIEELLKQADQTVGSPRFVGVDVSAVRRRAHTRRVTRTSAVVAVSIVLAAAVTIGGLSAHSHLTRHRLAALRAQVTALNARADATLALVRDVIEQERRQQELDALEARLAEFSDPLEETRKQIDETAFILVYHGDQMFSRLNDKAAAIESYRKVIKLFPDNHWAQVAQQRLSEIENTRVNKAYQEGDAECEPQDGQSG